MPSPFDRYVTPAMAARALHARGLAEGRGPAIGGGFAPTPYLDRELSNAAAQPALAREAAEQWDRDCDGSEPGLPGNDEPDERHDYDA